MSGFVTIPCGFFQTNCYIVHCDESKALYVIDPGGDAEKIFAELKKYPDYSIRILLTHAHFDHIFALGQVATSCNIGKVELSPTDKCIYESSDNAMLPYYPPAKNLPPTQDFAPSPDFRLLTLPGHSPGSCGFLFNLDGEKVLFSGDTIFAGSVGRTDLWGGDETALLHSVRNKILTLPDDTLIFPGHGESTSVRTEKLYNPFR